MKPRRSSNQLGAPLHSFIGCDKLESMWDTGCRIRAARVFNKLPCIGDIQASHTRGDINTKITEHVAKTSLRRIPCRFFEPNTRPPSFFPDTCIHLEHQPNSSHPNSNQRPKSNLSLERRTRRTRRRRTGRRRRTARSHRPNGTRLGRCTGAQRRGRRGRSVGGEGDVVCASDVFRDRVAFDEDQVGALVEVSVALGAEEGLACVGKDRGRCLRRWRPFEW